MGADLQIQSDLIALEVIDSKGNFAWWGYKK